MSIDLGDSISLSQLSKRQGVDSSIIFRFIPEMIRSQIKFSDLETALADSLYSGYIETQNNAVERVNHNDNFKVPEKVNFHLINGLSHEMAERLERAKPQTFGQVRKIPGLTSAALSTLLVYLTGLKY